jgi:hypothetical protein
VSNEPNPAPPVVDYEAAPAPPPPPAAPTGLQVRSVLRESGQLFRANAKAIMLPMAAVQIPLAVLGSVVPWVLYATVYSDQANPFDADSIRDGPRGLLFGLALVGWIWTMFLLVGFAGTIIAARDARKGTRRRLPELLDPPFTRLGGLFQLGMLTIALGFGVLLSSITILGPLFLLFVGMRIAMVFHAYVLGEEKAGVALVTSWRMMRGNVVRYMGLMLGTLPTILLLLLVSLMALIVISIPFAFVDDSRHMVLAASAAGTLTMGVFAVPILAYFTTATTVFYLTLRESPNARTSA